MIYIEFNDFTRLGNWMFQYATAISLHEDVGVVLACDYAKRKISAYKEIFKDINIVKTIPEHIKTIEYNPTTNDPIVLDKTGEDVLLKGLFQSPRYFDDELVSETFKPTVERLKELEEKFGEWLCRPNVTGIHVRRGDYLKVMHTNPFVGEKFLKKAVTSIPECNNFIVCSDDIPWCKAFFSKNFPKNHFLFVEGTTEVNDMYLLSRCKNNIISNGTFGWWASWLNPNKGKRVIAPTMWFGYKLKNAGVNWDDFYYSGVEKIKNGYSFKDYLLAHIQSWTVNAKVILYPVYKILFKPNS